MKDAVVTDHPEAALEAVRSPLERCYAVLWREDSGPVRAGKLTLGPRSLNLESGKARRRLSLSSFAYRDLVRIETTHDPRRRIKDQPTLVLHRQRGKTIALAVIEPRVSVHEIGQFLAGALPVTAAA